MPKLPFRIATVSNKIAVLNSKQHSLLSLVDFSQVISVSFVSKQIALWNIQRQPLSSIWLPWIFNNARMSSNVLAWWKGQHFHVHTAPWKVPCCCRIVGRSAAQIRNLGFPILRAWAAGECCETTCQGNKRFPEQNQGLGHGCQLRTELPIIYISKDMHWGPKPKQNWNYKKFVHTRTQPCVSMVHETLRTYQVHISSINGHGRSWAL